MPAGPHRDDEDPGDGHDPDVGRPAAEREGPRLEVLAVEQALQDGDAVCAATEALHTQAMNVLCPCQHGYFHCMCCHCRHSVLMMPAKKNAAKQKKVKGDAWAGAWADQAAGGAQLMYRATEQTPMVAWKALLSCCSMGRPSRKAMTTMAQIAKTGVPVRLFTALQSWWKGMPPSRLKDHSILQTAWDVLLGPFSRLYKYHSAAQVIRAAAASHVA